jgi:hypothetical protein
MGSTTRMVTAFGRRMTIEDAVSEMQWRCKGTVSEVAKVLGLPPQRLRQYAFAGIDMDARDACKLGRRITHYFAEPYRRSRTH